MGIKFNLWLLLGFLLGSQWVMGQSPVLKASVDKSAILIGEQIQYRIELSVPNQAFDFSWLQVPKEMDGFVIASKGKVDSLSVNGFSNFFQTLTLTNFDSGKRVIPSMAIRLNPRNGHTPYSLWTDSITVDVGYSPIDSVQPFHDIKTVIAVPYATPWWVWATIAMVTLLLLLLGIYLYRKYRKKEKNDLVFNSKLPPYKEAVEALNLLEKQGIPTSENAKEYFTKSSNILRRYLSRKTNKNLFSLTVDELLLSLTSMGLNREQISHTARALQLGNAVKFAKYFPPSEASIQQLKDIRNTIDIIHQRAQKTTESDL